MRANALVEQLASLTTQATYQTSNASNKSQHIMTIPSSKHLSGIGSHLRVTPNYLLAFHKVLRASWLETCPALIIVRRRK